MTCCEQTQMRGRASSLAAVGAGGSHCGWILGGWWVVHVAHMCNAAEPQGGWCSGVPWSLTLLSPQKCQEKHFSLAGGSKDLLQRENFF